MWKLHEAKVNFHHFVLHNNPFKVMTSDMSNVHSLYYIVPKRADEPSLNTMNQPNIAFIVSYLS